MFCWGNSVNGELGLGGIEEEKILSPRQMPVKFENVHVRSVACGENHTMFLFGDGSVCSCGSNDFGQLGHSKARRKLELLDSLKALASIKALACGRNHTLALSDWGGVYSWGANTHGQLGHSPDSESGVVPRLVKCLAAKQVVQIACGANHSLALLADGDLYSWGANGSGQLGLGTRGEPVKEPTLVVVLRGVPISALACGGAHCFALTRLGAVYGWGANSHGQLGQNDLVERAQPTHLAALRSQHVRHVACGEHHTAILTRDGGVFTFGAGTYGQLGHGGASDEILPRQVLELMGSPITQIACGRCHTLVHESKRNLMQAFGLGGSGQLGVCSTKNCFGPVVIQAPWNKGARERVKSDTFENIMDSQNRVRLKRIFCGGDQSFVLACQKNQDLADDFRALSSGQIASMNLEIISKFSDLEEKDETPVELSTYVETVFGSSTCISASFLPVESERSACDEHRSCIDVEATVRFFEEIRRFKKISVSELIQQTWLDMFPRLESTPADPEALRCYVIALYDRSFEEPVTGRPLRVALARAVLELGERHRGILRSWWGSLDAEDFFRIVRLFRDGIASVLESSSGAQKSTDILWRSTDREDAELLTRMLGQLFDANQKSGQRISYEAFYVSAINDRVDIFGEYRYWSRQRLTGTRLPASALVQSHFFLFDHPFVFDAEAKTTILRGDAVMQMQHAMDETNQRNIMTLFGGFLVPALVANPYLVLPVTRDNLVQNTLDCLSKLNSNEFRKPLKVMFVGEEAVDGGGVRKEFFMLLIRELIDAKYGMFREYGDTGCIWFHERSFEAERMFYMIGLVCGLAVYNGNIVSLPFPLVLYKKILGEPVRLEDLADLSPGLHRGLLQMLEYEGDDFEEVFAATFEVSLEAFGELQTYELKPGGAKQRVTLANRRQFADEYADFLLNRVVERQYRAFHEGFYNVLSGTVVTMFHAKELMAMVVGNENYDWDILEANAEYREGYTRDCPTICYLWKVFRSLTLEQKKKFLLFLTGYDRIPIFGMKIVKIVVQPMRTGDDFLPVAHTCFNLLDLPMYSSEEKLREKLLMAIDHSRGFALV